MYSSVKHRNSIKAMKESSDMFQDEIVVVDDVENGGTIEEKEKCKSKTEIVLSRIAPEVNPMVWLIINSYCLALSYMMLLILIQAPDGSVLWKIASGQYFEYNFVTTIIWCIEIGVTMWYDRIMHNTFTSGQVIEFLFAVYFIWDCIDQYMKHKNGEQNKFEDILSLLFNIIVYCHASYQCVLAYRRRNEYTTLA